VEFLLLGPMEAYHNGVPVDLGRRRGERCLLGLLLLEAGRVLPVDRLAALLWDDEPPDHARATLQTHVSRLRARLDPGRQGRYGVRLVSRGDGYLVETDPDRVDVHRFRRLVDAARRLPEPVDRAAGLRRALALWRGAPLADVASERLRDRVCSGLMEERLAALETCVEAELAAGAHHALLPELTDLVAEHPHRQRLAGALMLALHRAGRQPDALAAYHRVRARLADELGLDPGPQLRRLHESILRDDAPAETPAPAETSPPAEPLVPHPAQLPAEPAYFTGRDEQIAQLDRMIETDARAPTVAISALSGAGGVGKTALAVHWAHRVRDRFPDGQLYVDLQGYAPAEPARPQDVLARFLRALGVPGERVPADPDEAAGLYRTMLADKRMLVVLDNAHTADQVRPLLPGSRSCLAVVTSRDRLSGLVAIEGAQRVSLDGLTADEAVALLGRVIGAGRLDAEPDAVAALVDACGRLPLALRIAGANLAEQPDQSIAGYVELLTASRLTELQVQGDDRAAVRASFDLSYGRQSAPARRLFRLMSLAPGHAVSLGAAAALADLPTADAVPLVEALAEAHLLERCGPDRYTFHDLIRLYAAERLAAEEPHRRRADAVERLVDWYLAVAEAANEVLTPHHQALTAVVKWRPVELPFPPVPQRVRAFLDAEAANLPGVARFATEQGHHASAACLTYLLAGFFDHAGHVNDAVETSRWGLTAATRLGDPPTEWVLRSVHAAMCVFARRPLEALDHLHGVVDQAHRAGNQRAEAVAYNTMGRALRQLGRFAEAVDAYQHALPLFTAADQPVNVGMALNNIGVGYSWSGDLDRSFEWLTRALSHWRLIADQRGQARTLFCLGELHLRRGDLDAAGEALHAGFGLARELEYREIEGDTLHMLGQVDIKRGDHRSALAHLGEALSLAQRTGNRHQAAAVLTDLGLAHLRAGDVDIARQHLEAATSLRAAVPDQLAEADLRAAWDELGRSARAAHPAADRRVGSEDER